MILVLKNTVKKINSSKKIKNIDKINYDQKYKIIMDIIYVSFAILFISFLYQFTKTISHLIFENVNLQLKYNLLMTFIIIGSIIIVFDILKNYFCKRLKSERKRWISITIYIMLLTLVLGHVYIDFEFNSTEINLVLRDYRNHSEWGKINGNISCITNDGKVLKYGQVIICRLQPELYNSSKEITYRYLNGSEIIEKFEHNFVFRVPENIKNIGFQYEGYDKNNEYHNFIVSNNIKFISPEDEDMYEDRLITLYIWLVGVMFLIPTMMNNMKQLWDK